MHFKPNYPIYLQVVDYICERILTRKWQNGEKIPTLKELSVETSVNPNTVVKSLNYLLENSILYTQRGIGYFLTDNALEKTLALKRQQFIEEDLPVLFDNMRLLNLSFSDLQKLIEERFDNAV